MPTRGVYAIENVANGKLYIGSSINVEHRWRVHRMQLKAGTHCNLYLQAAWIEHGEKSFTFRVLVDTADADLSIVEQREIDQRGLALLYNILPLAYSAGGVHRRPETIAKHRLLRHTEKTKVQMSEARRRFLQTDAGKAAVKRFVVASLTPEVRGRINGKLRAQRLTPEYRLARSRMAKERGFHVPSGTSQKGRTPGFKHSEATRKKMSDSQLQSYAAGRFRGPHSPEHRAKIKAALIGKRRSPEQCANIRAGIIAGRRSRGLNDGR